MGFKGEGQYLLQIESTYLFSFTGSYSNELAKQLRRPLFVFQHTKDILDKQYGPKLRPHRCLHGHVEPAIDEGCQDFNETEWYLASAEASNLPAKALESDRSLDQTHFSPSVQEGISSLRKHIYFFASASSIVEELNGIPLLQEIPEAVESGSSSNEPQFQIEGDNPSSILMATR